MKPISFHAFLIMSFLYLFGINAYDEFGKACVLAHNKLRGLHGSQSLIWSEELADEAQKWCEKLALNDQLGHDNKTMDEENHGENIAAVNGSNLQNAGPTPDLCKKVVDEWYKEEQSYNYQTGMPKAPGMLIKNFAQVVWNSSFEIGVGSARSSSYGDIICARYSPRGAKGSPAEFKNNISPKTGAEATGVGGGLDEGNETVWSWGGGISHEENITCGIGKKPRIVGGSVARPEEFPWQVSFRTDPRGIMRHFCGGTLIGKKWVLTAAHCFPRGYEAKLPYTWAVLGDYDVTKDENETIIAIRRVLKHPNFVPGPFHFNDIALVELAENVSFNDRAKPICLSKEGITAFKPGTMCAVTGFGATRWGPNGGPQSNTLKKTKLPLVEDKTCAGLYGPQVKDHSFCAGFEDGTKTSACKGDSGGPLACEKDGKYYLIGATSWGLPCNIPGFPDVFTNVTFFMEWIVREQKLSP